ncbi:MAG: Rieske 2Fe-2S domain-containing protein [Immundisolibacter sp.]|uniref:Rieske 2Fe-2S domain-containing protein n=1 Tax=Immundisolibacter sp. TaxID=1934948 RepID=UPI003EE27ABC
MRSPYGLILEDGARQHRTIFWDETIYEQELQHIFARSWRFLTHESPIPNPGNYITTRMGEDAVIAIRQDHSPAGAVADSCRPRGNTVCHADSGNAQRFTCGYHGWTLADHNILLYQPVVLDRNLDVFIWPQTARDPAALIPLAPG